MCKPESESGRALKDSCACSGVRDIDEEDRHDVSVFPFDEESEAVRLGLEAHHGEEGYSTLERR